MALRRKGTRRITVDGAEYRWIVSADDEPGLGIVVESYDEPGRRLVVWIEHGYVISPQVVERAIQLGLTSGWDPSSKGVDLRLRPGGDQLGAAPKPS